MVYLLRLLLVIFAVVLPSGNSFALSEYGLKCDDNPLCVQCRNDLQCGKCMNNCWNRYYYADNDFFAGRFLNKSESCRLKRAKWCNAQCWAPDDTEEPGYISTKPDCDSVRFYLKERGERNLRETPEY